MKEFDKKSNTAYIYRTRQYKDEDGNDGTETEVYKRVYGNQLFWRVWLSDLLTSLGLISNSKQLDVVFYVLGHTNPSNNIYMGTIRSTAEATGVSAKTTSVIFKKMQEANIIKKKQNGAYFVKPSLLMKGDDIKRQRLIVEYEKVNKEDEANVRAEENDDYDCE